MSIKIRNILEKLAARYTSFSEFIVNKVVQKSGYSDFSSKPNIFWVHAINYVLLGGTIFTVAWLCIAQTDEVVVVEGKLQPTGKVKQVRIPTGSYIQEIYIKDGDYVNKGQPLFHLNTDRIKNKILSLQKVLDKKVSEISALNNSYQLLHRELDTTADLNKENIKSLQLNLYHEKHLLDKIQYLNQLGAVANTDFLRQQNKVSSVERSIIEIKIEGKKKLDKIKYQISQAEIQRSALNSEKILLESDLFNANNDLNQQLIRSPISGIVFDLKLTNIGFTSPEVSSTSVLKVVPGNKLQALVNIPSSKVGLMKIDQQVDISIDSFPSSDFGTFRGRLVFIGPDSIVSETKKELQYQGIIQLFKDNKSYNNKADMILRSGMSIKANIKLRKVSYLQLVFSTLFKKVPKIREV